MRSDDLADLARVWFEPDYFLRRDDVTRRRVVHPLQQSELVWPATCAVSRAA